MNYYFLLGIKIAVAVVLMIVLGNGSVVLFNRIPVKWFEDEGELPEELRDCGDGSRQRLTSTPWKYVFVALFGICGMYLAVTNTLQYEISVLVLFFVVLEIAIADSKYMVVPDQLNILLTVSAVGFIGFYDKWWEQLAGAAIGFALVLAIYGLGRIIYKKTAIGGADLKFFTAMGLVSGRAGVVVIFALTEVLIALHAMVLLVANRDALKEHRPMLPYAFAATLLYVLLLNDIIANIEL